MIYTYGFSQTGKSHEKKMTVCQDANCFQNINNEIGIAAVADGLGSQIHSDIGSSIAAQTVVEYCSGKIRKDLGQQEILDILRQSFKEAISQIEKRVAGDNGDILQYDTTLTLCVLICGDLYFGHAGDSGMIALAEDGKYYSVTDQQRDAEGRVFPLNFDENYWVFGKFEKKTAGVLLATDGMLELFFPVYIRNREVGIYTALVRYFLNTKAVRDDQFQIKEYREKRYQYVFSIPETIVDDDKTIVGIMDDSIEVHWQSDDYYKEPDWESLRKEYKMEYGRKAYEKWEKIKKNE